MGSPVQIPTGDTSNTSAGNAPTYDENLLLVKYRALSRHNA